MTLEEAKKLLNTCHREALNDHAFGDSEVNWYTWQGADFTKPESLVAGGYFGGSGRSYVSIHGERDSNGLITVKTRFEGDDARALQYCGLTSSSHRNDSGPY